MTHRKSRAVLDQIEAMHKAGHSIRKIADSLSISRNTVRRHVRELKARKAPKVVRAVAPPAWMSHIDWTAIAHQRKSGVTTKQLYAEYAPPVSYSQFGKHLQKILKSTPKPAPALHHKPGERVQIDYADGLFITDRRTGKKRKTQLFCGVLPFSSLTFAEFTFDQKLASFISSHERMWAFFGGVTPYVIVDNLKAGVTNAHRYDPDVNPTYCDYGNHCGFAVLPARPRTPRDKASIEAAIGVIQRGFYQEQRATSFYSLGELNEALRAYLIRLNIQVMADYGVSRRERFATEKTSLLPLPSTPYEIFEFKDSKVHPDCCIQAAKALYSVPFNYVGQMVRVKISAKIVVIFDRSNMQIAAHPRQPEYGRSILDQHLPPATRQIKSFDVVKSKAKAEAVGPKTKEYVDWQFDDERPLRVLRRIQGVLRLQDSGLSREAMEYAATQALQFRRRDLRYFSDCANYFAKTGGKPFAAGLPNRDLSTLHLRGGN